MSKAESARIIPVTPPVINVETKPIANNIAGVNTILPYNFTIDSNLDPFLVIEVTSDNGYGSIYRDKKNYEIRGIKDLTDKVTPIERIGPFVPIKYV